MPAPLSKHIWACGLLLLLAVSSTSPTPYYGYYESDKHDGSYYRNGQPAFRGSVVDGKVDPYIDRRC